MLIRVPDKEIGRFLQFIEQYSGEPSVGGDELSVTYAIYRLEGIGSGSLVATVSESIG